jgi:type VI protein secretion system component VasK
VTAPSCPRGYHCEFWVDRPPEAWQHGNGMIWLITLGVVAVVVLLALAGLALYRLREQREITRRAELVARAEADIKRLEREIEAIKTEQLELQAELRDQRAGRERTRTPI